MTEPSIPKRGRAVLEDALLNRGTAFTLDERRRLGLTGLLPANVETLEEQLERAWAAYAFKCSDMERHIYLRALQDESEVLFHGLLARHLVETMPIIYTPVVGDACEHFSDIYRRPRGLFVSYPDRGSMQEILANVGERDVRVVVVTDGERILGLGDQGAGGMGIPIGKLSLYTAAGGIDPATTLPVMLDVGTDNEDLLADPRYVGWRHARVRGSEYDDFIEAFLGAVQERWPRVLLQFEDFAKPNAHRLLERYRDRLCCFNDDIQGTAVVVAGSLLAACRATGQDLAKRTLVFVGAGSAGCGIAELVVSLLRAEGLDESEARGRVFMFDSKGLLHDQRDGLEEFQQRLAQPASRVGSWPREAGGSPDLVTVVEKVQPSVLIGVAGRAGTIPERVVRSMAAQHERPIVLPLSNPTRLAEATPEEVLQWSEGRALVATGSPFPPVEVGGRTQRIAQCNNTFVFPGLGLGVLASGATRVTDDMLLACAHALARTSPAWTDPDAPLLPELDAVREVSDALAYAVARVALEGGLADFEDPGEIEARVAGTRWQPRYLPLH